MKIAVTGATGFLGRYLVRSLVGKGHELRCWYRPMSDRGGLEPEASAIEWVPGELGDESREPALLTGVDAVVHSGLAWRRRASGFRDGAQERFLSFVEDNLLGSLRLFEAAFERGIGRFVFISTCAVHEVILPDRPLDETHPLWPTSHYGAHKAALEKFVHSFGLGQNWPICALRPTGIYGVARPASQSKWYDLVGAVLRGEKVDSPRGGKEVHAADVARAVLLLLEADATRIAGQAFNCYDRYISDEEVATIARRLSGNSSEISRSNRGPKNQIVTKKLGALGMTYGGLGLLEETVAALIEAHRRGAAAPS